MDNKEKDLITFSEAASIRGVTYQAIVDYVKRERLKPEIIGGKKFLIRQDVENLETGKGGRPSKRGNLEPIFDISFIFGNSKKTKKKSVELQDFHIDTPKQILPESYPTVSNFLIRTRKEVIKTDDSGNQIQVLWGNSNWRTNRKLLRNSLKNHSRSWRKYVCCDEIYVARKFDDSIIQSFYDFCLSSDRMYKKIVSIEDFKIDFLSHCEATLNIKPSKFQRLDKTKKRIFALFEEGIKEQMNPVESAFRVVQIFFDENEGYSKAQKQKLATEILRPLYETGELSTKYLGKLVREVKKNRQGMSKK